MDIPKRKLETYWNSQLKTPDWGLIKLIHQQLIDQHNFGLLIGSKNLLKYFIADNEIVDVYTQDRSLNLLRLNL